MHSLSPASSIYIIKFQDAMKFFFKLASVNIYRQVKEMSELARYFWNFLIETGTFLMKNQTIEMT